jgi:hypothetical protein
MRDTIELAREAGIDPTYTPGMIPMFKAFEALVRADEREQALAQPAPVQEPVAWGYIDEYGEVQKFKNPAAHKSTAYDNFQLLYTTPPAQPVPVQPAHISPKQLLALAQEANLGLDKVIEVFRMAAPAAQPAVPLTDDTRRLDALAKNSWDLRCFDMSDDDIGWRVIEHHMAKPHERTVAEVFRDDPRQAIDAAIEAAHGITKGQP